MFEKLWEANQLVMKNALEEDFSNPVQKDSAKLKAQNYYYSCMDPNGTIGKKHFAKNFFFFKCFFFREMKYIFSTT